MYSCAQDCALRDRRGRATSSPPQLGQRPFIASVQPRQNVHSYEQMHASALSFDRADAQRSHLSRISRATESTPLHQRVDAHIRVRSFTKRLRASIAEKSLRDTAREGKSGTAYTRTGAQPAYA